MRYLILLVALLAVSAPPAFSEADVNFDTFIKSREVVATFYFDSNADVLSKEEQSRLAQAVEQIRAIQNKGRLIRVEGFSSPEGNREENFKLSFFRARSVADMIESTGVPAEIALTGYGDLKARSEDLSSERRVEIASYLKPTGMKRFNVADVKTSPNLAPQTSAVEKIKPAIDAYSIDQAIRMKIDNKNKGLADQELNKEKTPGLSNNKDRDALERGYSLWRKSVDPAYAPKLSQSQQQTNDAEIRRFTKWQETTDPQASPNLSQFVPFKPPVIDALMIEQAIMEKIGAEAPAPTAAVSQVNTLYSPIGTSN